MHDWGEENVDWDGIYEAVEFIDLNLVRWGRIAVRQAKEKFGTVRIYCDLGFDSIHGLMWPRRIQIKKWWPYKLDLFLWYELKLGVLINWLITPFQKYVYTKVYTLAVKKWPHLVEEILCCADYRELLKNIPIQKGDKT